VVAVDVINQIMQRPTMMLSKLAIALLGIGVATVAIAEDQVNIQTVQYAENHERINVFTGEISVEKDIGTDYTVRLDYGYDAISGATPAWIKKPNYVNEYVEGQSHVSDEVRRSYGATVIGRDQHRNEYTVSVSRSDEPDFLSDGVSAQAQIWQDDQHNRAYIVGIGALFNTAIATAYTNNQQDKDSQSINVQVGLNQVIDQTSTIEGSLYYTDDDGYLSNHYLKIVRQNASTGQHELADDSRPDQRQSAGFSARWIKAWGSDFNTNVWYRFFQDDWGISSHTVELKAYYDLNDQWQINPVMRVYQQSAADFYRAYDDTVNVFSATGLGSNDARLGDFSAVTTQLNLTYNASKDWQFNVGVSHYQQSDDFSANWLTAGLIYHY
jgi:hypothetical protein